MIFGATAISTIGRRGRRWCFCYCAFFLVGDDYFCCHIRFIKCNRICTYGNFISKAFGTCNWFSVGISFRYIQGYLCSWLGKTNIDGLTYFIATVHIKLDNVLLNLLGKLCMSCIIKDTCIEYLVAVSGASICTKNLLGNCQLTLFVESIWREAAEHVFEGNGCCSIDFSYCCGVTIAKYSFIDGSICKSADCLSSSILCTLCNVVCLACLNILWEYYGRSICILEHKSFHIGNSLCALFVRIQGYIEGLISCCQIFTNIGKFLGYCNRCWGCQFILYK